MSVHALISQAGPKGRSQVQIPSRTWEVPRPGTWEGSRGRRQEGGWPSKMAVRSLPITQRGGCGWDEELATCRSQTGESGTQTLCPTLCGAVSASLST